MSDRSHIKCLWIAMIIFIGVSVTNAFKLGIVQFDIDNLSRKRMLLYDDMNRDLNSLSKQLDGIRSELGFECEKRYMLWCDDWSTTDEKRIDALAQALGYEWKESQTLEAKWEKAK